MPIDHAPSPDASHDAGHDAPKPDAHDAVPVSDHHKTVEELKAHDAAIHEGKLAAAYHKVKHVAGHGLHHVPELAAEGAEIAAHKTEQAMGGIGKMFESLQKWGDANMKKIGEVPLIGGLLVWAMQKTKILSEGGGHGGGDHGHEKKTAHGGHEKPKSGGHH